MDITSLLFGLVVGLAPSIGFLILRGTLFEYQEWRKQKQEKKKWYNKVERAANGIQRAWHYSGVRPEDKDRQRTVDEMDDLIGDLKEYRKHQNATDEIVNTVNEIIQSWDSSRPYILSGNVKPHYTSTRERFYEKSEDLKRILDRERKGYIRKFCYRVLTIIRDYIERVQRVRYRRRSIPISYEVHSYLSDKMTNECLSKFIEEDYFLKIGREHITEAVNYVQDEDKYNIIVIGNNSDGEIEVIDKLQGKTVTDYMLLSRLRKAETVDVIPYEYIISNEEILEEFKKEQN